jgi:flavin-dependent dehydrogenase
MIASHNGAISRDLRQRRVVNSEQYDIAVIGGGPAGTAAAIRAARAGLSVIVFEKAKHGRDKVCGDGLTPRAIGALN